MSSPTTDTRGGSAPGDLEPDDYPRKVLFVAGAGRSGTSTMAGLMQIMGLHVPQPEVVADETNPKGFGEPRWVVDHHDRLLKEAGVQVSDARPEAWFETGRVATREQERIRTAEWLESHFARSAHELVVKDPRLALVPRPVAGGRGPHRRDPGVRDDAARRRPRWSAASRRYYANRLGSAHLAASWLNMMLHTERAHPRVRRRRRPGLRPLRRPARRLGQDRRCSSAEQLELQNVLHAKSEQIRDGPPVRRPRAAPDQPEPGRPRACRRSCTS